jgi:hypothetical protein
MQSGVNTYLHLDVRDVEEMLAACNIYGISVQSRAIIVQKTGLTVQFELTINTREAVLDLINRSHLNHSDYLFKSRIHPSVHLFTRQY